MWALPKGVSTQFWTSCRSSRQGFFKSQKQVRIAPPLSSYAQHVSRSRILPCCSCCRCCPWLTWGWGEFQGCFCPIRTGLFGELGCATESDNSARWVPPACLVPPRSFPLNPPPTLSVPLPAQKQTQGEGTCLPPLLLPPGEPGSLHSLAGAGQ